MTSGYGWAVFETLLTLLGVCLLAVVTLKWLAKRGIGVGIKGTEMSVIDRVPLDARRSLVLVEVRGRTLLIGLGDTGAPSLISELPAKSFRQALAEAKPEGAEITEESVDRRAPDVLV